MEDLISNWDKITPDVWIENEIQYKEELLKLPSWKLMPLVNSNASHNIPDCRLVRFRGMIQDMKNPEFYFENFELINTLTNEVTTKSGKYRDLALVEKDEKINYASNVVSGQRQTFVIVSMPALNEWAQTMEDNENNLQHLEVHPNTSKRASSVKLKRGIGEVCEQDAAISEPMDTCDIDNVKRKGLETKEHKSKINNTPALSREHILNFPIPDVTSKSCIIKVYEENESLKLNDMVEVVGFLSVDPSLSGEFAKKLDSDIDESSEYAMEQIESEIEMLTHNPPPSLVPRIHAVYVKKLNHCNPLCNSDMEPADTLENLITAREYLMKSFTELLLGDKLAAEYMICHLISYVYLRQDALTIGQFALNISNIPIQTLPEYPRVIYSFIERFVTKSYYLPLTLENMNTMTFLPKKDYECNRLTSGLLQMSKNTHLVLDETKMQQGHLDATGVGNLSALGNLILTQKVEYDFKYYKMEFDTDIPILVFSEGKSLLPCIAQVPLKCDEHSMSIFNEIVEAAKHFLTPDILNTIRIYLTKIKNIQYTINDNLEFVQDDFIKMRSQSEPATADDLHRYLVLARLISLSYGNKTLSQKCWNITKNLEKERLARIKK